MAVPQVGIDGAGRLCVYHAVSATYDYREQIRDIPGAQFMWQAKPKFWYLPKTAGAASMLLSILADSGAKVSTRVHALAREGFGRAELRDRAADESLPAPRLPWHDWLKTSPWSWQQRGIAYLKETSAALVAMGMGGGKSLVAVGALNAIGAQRVLIGAPAAVLGVWPREFRRHSAREWHVLNGQRVTKAGTIKRLSLEDRWVEQSTALTLCSCGKPHAVVVSYAAVAADPLTSADLGALGLDVLLWDEGHALKSAGGVASQAAHNWVNQVPRRWMLTGTPLPQTPDDAYGSFRALDPSIYGTNKTEFRVKYIVMGKNREGKEYPKDVHRHARSEFSQLFHSITFLPTLDLQLPPVKHMVRPVELEPVARKAYDQLRDKGLAEITAAIVAAGGSVNPGDGERTVAPANSGVELLRLMQFTGGALTDDDGRPAIVSKAKQAALATFTGKNMTGGLLHEVGCRLKGLDGHSEPVPVVVFAKFTHDLAAVREVAERAGLRYREISGSRKDGLDADSCMTPDADVVGVQIASGGVGIDLTRACVCIWYSVGHELWLFEQALKRLHRPGQTRPVRYYHLIAERTIDGATYKALATKRQIIDTVVDDYLRDRAEVDSGDLPEFGWAPDGAPDAPVDAEAVPLPGWLSGNGDQIRSRRDVPDHQSDMEHAALALAGLEGF